jgi:SAM-dependent methyltransferase
MRLCGGCRAPLVGREWECGQCGWRAPVRNGIAVLFDREAPEAFTSTQAQNVAVVDPAHFWFAARNRLIAWMLAHHAPSAQTFFETGCGTGSVLRGLGTLLPHLRLTGADVSMPSLQLAAVAAPAAAFVYADTRQLPFDGEFDAAGAFDVLEHIADHHGALQALVRTVRPGGLVLLTVPQHRWLWSPLDNYSGHQRRYTRAELVALATTSGLDVISVTSFVSLLLPGMLLSRLRQRGREVAPRGEFDMSSWVNSLATGMMRIELAVIRAGLSLPAGGSLMLAGRRR